MQVSAAFQHPVTPAPPQTWLHSQVTRRACCTHQCACVQFECVTQAPDLLLLRQVVALASAKLKELESGSTGQRMGEAQVREAAFRVFAELSPPGSPEQSYFWKGGLHTLKTRRGSPETGIGCTQHTLPARSSGRHFPKCQTLLECARVC